MARDTHDRRRHPRLKSVNSVELYPIDQNSPIRARTADIGLGGCFVEMSNPLAVGTLLRLGLWVRETKLSIQAKVVSMAPGFGNGVAFVQMSELDQKQLKQFLDSINRISR
jgi:c-di-GMP-binding flagellar brake protein YcgR